MDEKFENILRRAEEIFLKYGIRSVSMDDICRELGVSKKTLYQYVPNKKELIKVVLDYSIQEKLVKIFKLESKKANAIDFLLETSKMINKHHKEFNPSAIFDLEKYYPDLYKDFLQKRRVIILKWVKNNIHAGKKEGLYRDDLDIDLVALLYVQKLEDLTTSESLSMKKNSFSKIFEVMFENHIRGISNKKGVAYFEKKKAKIYEK